MTAYLHHLHTKKYLCNRVALLMGVQHNLPLSISLCLKLIRNGAKLFIIDFSDDTCNPSNSNDFDQFSKDINYLLTQSHQNKLITYIKKITNSGNNTINEILDTCYDVFNNIPDLFCNLDNKNHIHIFNCLIEDCSRKFQKLNNNEYHSNYPVIELKPLSVEHWYTSGWLGSSLSKIETTKSQNSSSLEIRSSSDNDYLSYFENIKLNVICNKDLMLRLTDIQKPNTGDIITYYKEDGLILKTNDLYKTLGYLAFNGPFVKNHEFQVIKDNIILHSNNQVLIEINGQKYKEEIYKKSKLSSNSNSNLHSYAYAYAYKKNNEENIKENDSMSHLIRKRINGTFDAYLKKLRDYPFEWYNIDDDIIGSGSVSQMKSGKQMSFSIIDDASSRKLLKNAAYLTIRWFLVFGYIIVVLAMPKVLGWSIN